MGRVARERAAKAKAHDLLVATGKGDLRAVRLAIKNGADVNTPSLLGGKLISPLFGALYGGDVTMIRLLVESGAEINQVVDTGLIFGSDTALSAAAQMGCLDVCVYLLEQGAELHPVTSIPPLHQACHGGHVSVVEELIARGADPKHPDKDGKSALARARSHEVIDFLFSSKSVSRSIDRRICAFCAHNVDITKPTFKVCGRCRGPRYCSRHCQKAHWKAVTKSNMSSNLFKAAHRDQCEAIYEARYAPKTF